MTPPKPVQEGTSGGAPEKAAARPSSAPKPVDNAAKTKDHFSVAPKVEIPKGGGAIRSIGEKFQANPVTGTAGITIPIAMSPGRGGFQPALSLSYSSGGGNGPFGLGWSLSLPSVRRKTDKGLPEYRDATDSDVFVLSDAEDLVPMRTWSGTEWVDVTSDWSDGTFTWDIRRYRPRIDSAFARIERWTRRTDGDVHWRTISTKNVTRIYGDDPSARLADPDDATRVFEWFLEEERDELGSVTKYEYGSHDDDEPVEAIYERNRGTAQNGVAYTYLERVYYGNVDPFSAAGGFYFELVFDYGNHTADPPTRTPDDPVFPARQDIQSSYRAGFDSRCYRLCSRVLLFHRFNDGTDGDAVLVRATELAHAENGIASTLTSVVVRGYRDGDDEALPAISFTYAAAEIEDTESLQFVQGVDDLPTSLDISRYQWVDLDGEGLTGLLTEQGGAWYYKRNEGQGTFGARRQLGARPAFDLNAPGSRLVDVDGDGRLELVRMGGGVAGYFGRDADGSWQGFRAFARVPTAAWNEEGTRTLDLDGDGLPDLLVTENEAFTWYPNAGTEGWENARRAWRQRDEERGPTVLFASGQEAILLADINGDGLTDLVRVRNGSICYWPNKGYGRFGAKVEMEGAPRFDRPDRFDPRRVRLADIDGAGPADLIYLGPRRVTIWFNESGNRWSTDSTELQQVPGVEDSATVSFADLLGNGTQCLVWSSPLLRDGWAPLRFVELMPEGKPYLLTSIDNGLGRTTTLSYKPSTQFYVDDRAAGTPWATRLPFPVQCLERVDVSDAVTGWRFVTTYAYHHGYYDGVEREFRGFGMVEQRDAESIDDYAVVRSITAQDLPPVVTRTWFHTGAWKDAGTLEEAFAAEYFVDVDAFALGASTLSDQESGWAALTPTERRQAARALKGRPLRQEVYAEDGDLDREPQPYVVSANNYAVTRLQAGEADHAVFRVDAAETVTWHYERDFASTLHPRVLHALTLAVDAYGNVTRSASVAYAKRGTTGTDPDEIARTVVTVTEADVANDVDGNEADEITPHWHVGLPCAQRTYELTGVTLAETTSGRATVASLQSAVAGATRIDWDATPSGTTLRLLSHQQTSYFLYDATTGLGGETFWSSSGWVFGTKALVYQSYVRAYTDGFLTDTDALGSLSRSSTDLEAAGYRDAPGDGWWVPSGTRTLDTANFFVPTVYTDPFGGETDVTWDAPHLFVVELQDALPSSRNTITAEIDYVAMQPSRVVDPNGNWTRATYDALGRVVETRVVGKDGEGEWSDADPWTGSGRPVSVTDPTSRYTYNLAVVPAYVYAETRQAHGATAERWYERYTYSDGGGNVVQDKVNAEPDEATLTTPRWVGTGRVVLNNKGLPVKKYEPFFSDTSDFEYEDEVAATGVTPILYYDPPGRVIRVELPNGTLRRVEFDPWSQTTWDENDSVNHDRCIASTALKALAVGADTPTTVYLDVLGRAYQTDEMYAAAVGATPAVLYTTSLTLDVVGNPEIVTDALGVATQTQSFDLLGRPMTTRSPDAGDTTTLLDVAGQPVAVLRSGGLLIEYTYDALRRATRVEVTEASTTRIVEINEYGEAQGDALNHKGKLYQQWDTAGRVVADSYDFKGNPLSTTRRFWDYAAEGEQVDWTGTPATDVGYLEADPFTTVREYDALNRPTSETAPDGSETVYTYNDAGLLETVAVDSTPYIEGIVYNARGQRLEVDYGNDTTSTYTYEAETFRLSTLTTTHDISTDDLQALSYTYDPVGNVREITDDAQDTTYFKNTVVSPDQSFTYDPLYRLATAAGREKTSRGQTYYSNPTYEAAYISTSSPLYESMELYTEEYAYDAVGNLKEVIHRLNGATNWTRDYTYEEDGSSNPVSNRLVSTTETAGTVEYQHDVRGSIVFLPHLYNDAATPDPTPNVTPDFRGQMRRAELNATDYALYFYDASGQRVRKVVIKGANTEDRRYIGAYEVWSKTGTSTEGRTTLHVMDGQQRIAMIETNTVTSAVRFRYQLGNHLGSSSLELDEDGNVITYEEYHPYGSTAWWAGTSDTEVSQKRYRYTGMERDEETGLQCHGARYYAVWLGRWTSPDPIGLGDGVNRYAYAHNRPTGGRDPTGTQDQTPISDVPGESGQTIVVREGTDPTGGVHPESYVQTEYIAFDSRTMKDAYLTLAEARLTELAERAYNGNQWEHRQSPTELPSLLGIEDAWGNAEALESYDPLAIEAYQHAVDNPLDAVAVHALRQLSDSTGESRKEHGALIYIPPSLSTEFKLDGIDRRSQERKGIPSEMSNHIRIDYYAGSGQMTDRGTYTVEDLPNVTAANYDAAAHSHPIQRGKDPGFSHEDQYFGIGTTKSGARYAVPVYLADHREEPGLTSLERTYSRFNTYAFGYGYLTGGGVHPGALLAAEPSPFLGRR